MAADPVLTPDLVGQIFSGNELVSRQTLRRLEKGESKDPALFTALATALSAHYAPTIDGERTGEQTESHKDRTDMRERALRLLANERNVNGVEMQVLLQKAAIQDRDKEVRTAALQELRKTTKASPEMVLRLARRMNNEMDTRAARELAGTIATLGANLETRYLPPIVQALAKAARELATPEDSLATLASLAKRDSGARKELEAIARNDGAFYSKAAQQGAAEILVQLAADR